MSILDRLLIVTALAAALWWAVSRHRRPAGLEAFSFAAAFLAVLTLALGILSGTAHAQDSRGLIAC